MDPFDNKIVVSLCDKSGVFAEPWAEAGYDCYCVDTCHSIRRPRTEGRITFAWGDVRSWIPPDGRIAFVAAFPPCTHLAVSGARDFKTKGLPLLSDALGVFNACVLVGEWSGAPYFVENPVGVLSSHHRKPDHTFDPCDYGGYCTPPDDAYTKRTHLWSGNGFVMPPPKRVEPVERSRMHFVPPGGERADIRSQTPRGFARAVFESNAPDSPLRAVA